AANELAIFGGTPVLSAADHRVWPQLDQEDRDAVSAVLERGILSGGAAPAARAFERDFAASLGVEHALLTHSGTSALELALLAAGIKEGDEVIVPAYTFVATPLSVMYAGAI